MDIQEAIDFLQEKLSPCVTGKWKEAVDMVISALQAQESKKSRCSYKPDCPWSDGSKCNSPNDPGYNECDYDRGIFPEPYEEEIKNSLESSLNQKALDTISRQVAIDALMKIMDRPNHADFLYTDEICRALERLPSAQPEWNNHTVARLLAELFDDTCACNYNGINEWLPEKCEVIDSCPDPVGVACWEQYLKYRVERRTDGQSNADGSD